MANLVSVRDDAEPVTGVGTVPTVLAGVSGSRSGGHVIRRGIRRAGEDDAELLVVDVNVAEGLDQPRAEASRIRRPLPAPRWTR